MSLYKTKALSKHGQASLIYINKYPISFVMNRLIGYNE